MLLRKVNADIYYLSTGYSFGGSTKRKESEQNDENCPICYEPLSENPPINTTSCGHTFHTLCLCNWLRSGNNTCPYCRNEFTEEQINEMCVAIPKPPPKAKRRLTYDDLENPQRRQELGIPPAVTLTWGRDFD